jgi:hypothetical protein
MFVLFTETTGSDYSKLKFNFPFNWVVDVIFIPSSSTARFPAPKLSKNSPVEEGKREMSSGRGIRVRGRKKEKKKGSGRRKENGIMVRIAGNRSHF